PRLTGKCIGACLDIEATTGGIDDAADVALVAQYEHRVAGNAATERGHGSELVVERTRRHDLRATDDSGEHLRCDAQYVDPRIALSLCPCRRDGMDRRRRLVGRSGRGEHLVP